MPDCRRVHVPGGTYFFTVNTYRRQTFLADADVRSALRQAIGTLRSTHPFANELARTRVLRSLQKKRRCIRVEYTGLNVRRSSPLVCGRRERSVRSQ
jgi:hypothetical protein